METALRELFEAGKIETPISLSRSQLELDPQVLVGKAHETLKLRIVIVQMLFGLVTEASDSGDGTVTVTDDKVMELCRIDPYMSGLDEFRFADAVVTLDSMRTERDKWDAKVKTVCAPVLWLFVCESEQVCQCSTLHASS